MNRRKKIIKKLTKKHKQAQAKKQPQKKDAYISKADREKMAVETETENQTDKE